MLLLKSVLGINTVNNINLPIDYVLNIPYLSDLFFYEYVVIL